MKDKVPLAKLDEAIICFDDSLTSDGVLDALDSLLKKHGLFHDDVAWRRYEHDPLLKNRLHNQCISGAFQVIQAFLNDLLLAEPQLLLSYKWERYGAQDRGHLKYDMQVDVTLCKHLIIAGETTRRAYESTAIDARRWES